MKVYELKVDHSKTNTLFLENYEELSSHSIQSDFNGQALFRDWKPIEIQTVEQERQRKYEETLLAIERNKGGEFTYTEAEQRMDQGRAIGSGKWRMQFDDDGEFWLGELTLELKYRWGRPVYIPPILLGYMWHEVEKAHLKSKHTEGI